MTDVAKLWRENRSLIENKTIAQIISFIGNGNLSDESQTSLEFRSFLDIVSSNNLNEFVNHCLQHKFTNSGFVLQDIINQIGKRLEYEIEYGLYQGRKNSIGFDGIWKDRDGYCLVIEVKTTDAFRINLDDIAKYRKQLASDQKIDLSSSSILIVVGREDTGDLEAQIRGSKHAWDIRIISTDSLVSLLQLKENLNDVKTVRQIHELLKPKEFTRVDSLIEIITQTAEDFADPSSGIESVDEGFYEPQKTSRNKFGTSSPVGFNAECIENISKELKITLIKSRRVLYFNKDRSTGIVCIVSKEYTSGSQLYWYAFHPYHTEFLLEFKTQYVAFGCGSPRNILLIPYDVFSEKLKYLNTTNKKNDSFYYHIHINVKGGSYFLKLHKKTGNKDWDVSRFLMTL